MIEELRGRDGSRSVIALRKIVNELRGNLPVVFVSAQIALRFEDDFIELRGLTDSRSVFRAEGAPSLRGRL